MAIHQTPKTDSTRAARVGVTEQARRDLISLSLAPIRQSLTFYADIQRSALDTFTRFMPWGTSHFSASGEGVQITPKPAATKRSAAPVTKSAAANKSATTKRPTTAHPAATKRPTTTKRPTAPPTPRQATGQGVPKKSAAKTAPKPVESAGRTKPATAKKAASSPSRSRSGRASAARKA